MQFSQPEAQDLLRRANALLRSTNDSRLKQQRCESMTHLLGFCYLPLYTFLTGIHFHDIYPEPATSVERVYNALRLLDSLSKDLLGLSLHHIKATNIASFTDLQDHARLIEIFESLFHACCISDKVLDESDNGGNDDDTLKACDMSQCAEISGTHNDLKNSSTITYQPKDFAAAFHHDIENINAKAVVVKSLAKIATKLSPISIKNNDGSGSGNGDDVKKKHRLQQMLHDLRQIKVSVGQLESDLLENYCMLKADMKAGCRKRQRVERYLNLQFVPMVIEPTIINTEGRQRQNNASASFPKWKVIRNCRSA